MTNNRLMICAIATGFVLSVAGCGKNQPAAQTTASPSGEASVVVGSVPATVNGNVVTIPVTVSGITIVKADGDTSGRSGHFHVFIDKTPVAVGQVVPKEPGIVHTADMPIKLYGLKTGAHTFHIVLGDGTHKRITNVDKTVSVDVKGPSVTGTTPATITAGSALTVALASSGVQIIKADGDTSGKSGHYHVLVDPAAPPKAGEVIPPIEANKIIHTAESSATISDLAKGEHVIWIVLGDGAHKAFDPAVMDKRTVTVT